MRIDIPKSDFLSSQPPYPFAEVDKAKAEAKKNYPGEIIDMGVGDPTEFVTERVAYAGAMESLAHIGIKNMDAKTREIFGYLCESIDLKPLSDGNPGYPSYIGHPRFREIVAERFKRVTGITLDPNTEITTTLGSKDSIFCDMYMAYVNPGDIVLSTDPGYPPTSTGVKQRGGKVVLLPLTEENEFMPDLQSLDDRISLKAKILNINSPNNPTTKIYSKEFLKEVYDFAIDTNTLVVSDEAYFDMYYGKEPPLSYFEVDKDFETGGILHSLSKTANMTNDRLGWIGGSKEFIDRIKEAQTNRHSGQTSISQIRGIAAYTDEVDVEKMRESYRERKGIMVPALQDFGLDTIYADGTFYLWVKAPENESSFKTSTNLLKNYGINTTPGEFLAQETKNGAGFIRFALVPDLEKTKEAASRL